MLLTKPYRHQPIGVDLMSRQRTFALHCEPGTGKSWMTLADAYARFQAKEINLLAIVAPNGVHWKWIETEVATHLPPPYHAVAFSRKMKYDDFQYHLKRIRSHRTEFHIISVGFGAFSHNTDAARAFVAALKLTACILVVDESTWIKAPKAERSKRIVALRSHADIRRTLSGTPIANGVQDLYMPFRFLDPKIINVATFSGYKGTFCKTERFEDREGRRIEKIVGTQNLDVLKQRIAPYVYEVRKNDCLDLPAKRYERISVALSAEQRRHYKTVKDDFLLVYGDGTMVDVPMAITRLLRLQQIVGGFLPDGTALDCPRLDETLDRVEADVESGLQVIVWARFKPEIQTISGRLNQRKIRAVTYSGADNEASRAHNLEQFQGGLAPVLVGTQAAGGIGLDMTRGERVYFYSNTFSYVERVQAEDRVHRIGLKNVVIYHDLHADRTVDGLIQKALHLKQSVAEMMSMRRKDLLELMGD